MNFHIYFFIGSIYATQSVFGAAFQYYSPIDLQTFQKFYNLIPQSVEIKHGHTIDYCIGTNNCDEANLDVQYLTALSQNTNTTFWFMDESKSGVAFLNYLIELLELTQPPLVNSISYGQYEEVNLSK